MKVSAQEEYGLRCALHLARGQGKVSVSITEIAEREGISVPYVAKLMGLLRKGNLVNSARGRQGGYLLARASDQVTVADVLRVLDEPLYDTSFCDKHHGQPDVCVRLSDCTIRALWASVERSVEQVTGKLTLADLLRGEKNFRPLEVPSTTGASAVQSAG